MGDVEVGREEAWGQALLATASLRRTYLEYSFNAFRNATLRDGFTRAGTLEAARKEHAG